MKKTFIGLLVLIIIGAGSYLYLNKTQSFTPSVSIVSPKGGEEFMIGERFRYVISVNHQKTGSLKVFITTSDDYEKWRASEYYDLGEMNSDSFDEDNYARSSFVMLADTKNIVFKPGKQYYLLGTWESNDKTEAAYGFSSYQFGISSK